MAMEWIMGGPSKGQAQASVVFSAGLYSHMPMIGHQVSIDMNLSQLGGRYGKDDPGD
jgi:hypothetical protein